MAFRLLRICSNPATLKLRLKELKSTFLIPRGYKSIEIDTVFSKILALDRKNVLQKIRKHKKILTMMSLQYHLHMTLESQTKERS